MQKGVSVHGLRFRVESKGTLYVDSAQCLWAVMPALHHEA